MPSMVTSNAGVWPASKAGLTGLNPTSPAYSWAWWMKAGPGLVGAAWEGIYYNYGSAYNRQGVVLAFATKARIYVYSADDGSQETVPSTQGLILQEWAHYGISWNGVTVLFVRNGRLFETKPMTKVPTFANPRTVVCGQSIGGTQFFDFRVFPNVALTVSEIRAAMDPRKEVGNCKARWFRNWRAAAGSTLYDESGNGNDLTTDVLLSSCQSAEEPPWREAVGA